MIVWHIEHNNLNFGTIVLGILVGIAVAPILRWEIYKQKKQQEADELERSFREFYNDFRRRYENVSVINNINRNRLSPSALRAEWRRQNGKRKLNDFKFFRSNDKD